MEWLLGWQALSWRGDPQFRAKRNAASSIAGTENAAVGLSESEFGW